MRHRLLSFPVAVLVVASACSSSKTATQPDADTSPDGSSVVDGAIDNSDGAIIHPDLYGANPDLKGSTADLSMTMTGGPFPDGTICNASGTPLTPPATIKHLIVMLFENENFGKVNGNTSAPYISSLATQCGYASMYLDNCFGVDRVSLPHYLALTSGSNCNTGLDNTGTGCITDDGDATSHTLSTPSIFSQVSSWKSYQEAMVSTCNKSSTGAYACKHNPAAYYSTLASCTTSDVPIDAITCSASKKMNTCTTPANVFVDDLANDTLPQFSFITPTLNNDMHDGTVTQGDNWLYTYMPLIFKSKAYLRGDVAVLILWDEQGSYSGGATPNVFISPYITAGTVAATPMNHFALLRAMEKAMGITTYLGCASGMQPGASGGACPAGSTADVRAALNF